MKYFVLTTDTIYEKSILDDYQIHFAISKTPADTYAAMYDFKHRETSSRKEEHYRRLGENVSTNQSLKWLHVSGMTRRNQKFTLKMNRQHLRNAFALFTLAVHWKNHSKSYPYDEVTETENINSNEEKDHKTDSTIINPRVHAILRKKILKF